MYRPIILLSLLLIGLNVYPQENNLNIKVNTGMLFSKPGNDLANVADNNHASMFISAEKSLYRYDYPKINNLGVALSGVVGLDGFNLLTSSRLTRIDATVASFKGRIYPLSSLLGPIDFIEAMNNEIVIDMFPLDLIANFLYVISINSLHFDLGAGAGFLVEKAFIEGFPFEPETTTRLMFYSGWGLQPQIFQSDNDKWIVNAVFDFGRYSWKNKSGGISSMSANYLGFGVQYNF